MKTCTWCGNKLTDDVIEFADTPDVQYCSESCADADNNSGDNE